MRTDHIALNLDNLPKKPSEFFKGKIQPDKHRTFQVPNIVHYIWYTDATVDLRFDKALSVLSAIKNLKPDAVYFHTNKEPSGKYFEMLKSYSIFKVGESVYTMAMFRANYLEITC